jgi:hypothetical protein
MGEKKILSEGGIQEAKPENEYSLPGNERDGGMEERKRGEDGRGESKRRGEGEGKTVEWGGERRRKDSGRGEGRSGEERRRGKGREP